MRERLENLLGAFVTATAGTLDLAVETAARRGGSAPAALALLLETPGRSIEGLRTPLGLSHSATVRVVDNLERDGLVMRRPGADGRTVSLMLTGAGRRRAESVRLLRAQAMHHALRHLRPAERRQLESILERVLATAAVDHERDEVCRLCDHAVCPERRCPVARQLLAQTGGATRFA